MLLPFALLALGALQARRSPAEVLAEVDRALAAASPFSVQATLSRTQALTWRSHVAEGTLVVDRARGAFRVDARVRELRQDGEREITLAREGARFFFLDHGAHTFVEGDTPALGGLAGRMCLDLAQLTPSEPAYTAKQGAPALRESLTVGGERCLTLVAKVPDGPTAQTWYVGERDFLPRLWESARDLGEGDSLSKRCTVHALEPHAPALPPFAVPAGYARGEPEAWSDPEERAARPDAGGFASLVDGIEPLRAQFNAEKGKVRALGLFAPT
jgi:hypothetical protein